MDKNEYSHFTNIAFDEIIGRSLETATLLNNLKHKLDTLLYGCPGVGKTFITHFIGSILQNCSFIIFPTTDFASKFISDVDSKLDEFFDVLAKKLPLVVFIDDFEFIAPNVFDRITNFRKSFQNDLTIITATQAPWKINQQYLSYFPEHLLLDIPNKVDRKNFIIRSNNKLEELNLSIPDIDFIVERTDGASFSDLCVLIKQIQMIPIKLLMNSQFFYINDGKYYPCSEDHDGSINVRFNDLNWDDVAMPLINKEMIIDAVSAFSSSITTEMRNRMNSFKFE